SAPPSAPARIGPPPAAAGIAPQPAGEGAGPHTEKTTIESKTAKLQKLGGYIPLYWDAENGKLFMQLSRFGEELLYQVSLPAGVGSNPIGLDRGLLGQTQIVSFERIGPKVLMTATNYRFRALSNDEAERRAVADSFARSVLWSFKVEATDATSVLVDGTDFFLSDQQGVTRTLGNTQQGSYALDKNRSAIYLPRTKVFPRNTEVEAVLTFQTSDRPGPYVSGVTPIPDSVTVREHHSLVALPPPGYTPRRADPRVGVFSVDFFDYASPFTGPIEKQWIARHRLVKKDPGAAVSDAVEPIVYYVDPGAPEPIRGALIEGASWWNAAFEAAGFRNAFQVKVLPADADPMDLRYNMINWVHRAQRGWSYGAAVIDPRSGEILKGNVTLGSLRIRQDVLIAEGLVPQFDELHDRALAELDAATSPSMMALARIRQLAAHETGHTLGLDHNMAASSYGRASVMDYPSPYVKIADGKLDLSEAYTKGIGAYDKWVIRYAYAQFAPGANGEQELNRIVREAPLFITDPESRPVSAAHPQASVWDSPGNAVQMLRHEIEVRRIALSQFGLRNIPVGTPLAQLEEMLVPLYLHHRYQLEAAAKSIGGLDYTYSVKEEGGLVPTPTRRILPAAAQRDALTAVLSTLEPSFLEISPRILGLIPPRGNVDVTSNTELFDHRTTPAFDPVSAAMASADITLAALLDARRAARLVQFHAEDASNPDFNEIVSDVIAAATRRESGYRGSITRATARLAATRLMDLAANRDADPQVRAEASEGLRRFAAKLSDAGIRDDAELAHRHALRDDIERFLARPDQPRTQPKLPEVPPGPPIGD
ncbi:MAG: zinc-dependent metalloprotease, partial [Acidobacteriota bacterium]|nr:zinc-dependent metalloprotease [Acidobacteriota bacterium]